MAESNESSASTPCRSDRVFHVGDRVVLMNLTKVNFNQHVGRIVTDLSKSGRHGVCLQRQQPTARDSDTAEGTPRQARSHRFRQPEYPPIALKPENLQHVPCDISQDPVAVAGSIGPKTVCALFGERGWGLADNVVSNISDYLLINRISADRVSVTGCSSSRGDFPLEAVLNAASDEWWISGPGSMPGGRGREYLEFSFGPSPRRIEFVALRIPAMPYGPLSVRCFVVRALSASGEWVPATPELQTLDRADLQEFALVPAVDTTGIRIECLSTASVGQSISDCIGLFQVVFS